ncbi:PIN-like domain-containing protein [Deinococcus marmoris]|uniref:PIN-like domain-containing protein n=1 Tax=Deinococcus marmoris TaxID=249408 RepID=UPI0039EF4C0F
MTTKCSNVKNAVQDAIEIELSGTERLAIKMGKKDENSAGDLIIWHTILKIGESRKKPIVFVSGDTKADWWTQSMNSPLFPRFELLQEYKKSSDGQPIFFINFVDLLKKMHAQQSVIRDVTQKTDDQYNLWQRRNNLNRTMVLSKDRLEVHHLHRAYTDICFQSSEEIAGKVVDLRLSILDSGNGVSHLKLETETLDFSDIEPSESPISRQISIFASETPPQFVQRDTYGALTDIFLISASIEGKNIGQNTIIIEEKLLDM